MGIITNAILVLMIPFLLSKLFNILWAVFWRPYFLTKTFKNQGIIGPPRKLVSGSLDDMKRMKTASGEMVLDSGSNDIVQKVVPHYNNWSLEYGEKFLYWHGTEPHLCITDVEMTKQVLSNKFGFYVKPRISPTLLALIGNGLVFLEGSDWVRHRRTLNPAFSLDKLKAMVKKMAACAENMVEEWKNHAKMIKDGSEKIEMGTEFTRLTADIISHTAFGSNYVQGLEVFQAQRQLQSLSAAAIAKQFIPGSQYLPTPSNIRRWQLDAKMKRTLKQIVEGRLQKSRTTGSPGDDLLGLLIASSETNETKGEVKINMDEIMEECKTFFFAGHETTSNLLTWTVFLLSKHQEWQDKLREEVLKECGTETPVADSLAKLKLVNMVLLEALRLYGPVIAMTRKATTDMALGDLMIPKHTVLVLSLVQMHRKKEYWGEDANEFNPLRFQNGISKAATHPNALLGFSIGPRACIGQNFALLEAKTVVAVILQKFCFSLSDEYKHAPTDFLTLKPQHGLPIVFKPLNMKD